MATLNAKDFLRTLVFGHFTHPNYHQIKFTFDNGVLGFEMKDTRSGNEFKGSCDVSNCEDAYFVMRQVGKQSGSQSYFYRTVRRVFKDLRKVEMLKESRPLLSLD